jgi:hypothetical protein
LYGAKDLILDNLIPDFAGLTSVVAGERSIEIRQSEFLEGRQ